MKNIEEIKSDFKEFINLETDRTSFITNYLESMNVKSTVINLNGKKHIYVNFGKSQYNGFFKLKTLIAHYDRVPKSEGANDNSFAVFQMMNWAAKLNSERIEHNIRLIFTDGEENGIKAQGSFDLAGTFRRLGILSDDIFVFDCLGRGTIPVLQKMPALKKATSSFKKRINSLYETAEEILKKSTDGKWVSLPVSWSDNAGFLAEGIPSVLITMLPSDEASLYMMNIAKNPELEKFVVNHEIPKNSTKSEFELLLPLTWSYINSEKDRFETITWESAEVFERILDEIAIKKTIATKKVIMQ